MTLGRLSALCPFVEGHRLEKFIVQAVKDNVISVRVCHRTNSIIFGGNAFLTQTDLPDDGPRLQSLQSEMMRGQLMTLAKRLHAAVDMIIPSQAEEQRKQRRRVLLSNLDQKLEHEHIANLNRKSVIEDRKFYIESVNKYNQQQMADAEAKAREEAKIKEQQRQEKEEQERKLKKIADEKKKMAQAVANEKIERLSSTALGAKVIKKISKEKLGTMSADEIHQLQVEMSDKERSSMQSRLKANEKSVDYLERAKRLVEVEKLKVVFQSRGEETKRFWEDQVKAKLEASKKNHQKALEVKKSLASIQPAKEAFMAKLMERRQAEFEKEKALFAEKMEQQVRNALWCLGTPFYFTLIFYLFDRCCCFARPHECQSGSGNSAGFRLYAGAYFAWIAGCGRFTP